MSHNTAASKRTTHHPSSGLYLSTTKAGDVFFLYGFLIDDGVRWSPEYASLGKSIEFWCFQHLSKHPKIQENSGNKLILPKSPERIKSYETRILSGSPDNQLFEL